MLRTTGSGRAFRFGVFEVDLVSGELRKHGLKIKLPEQPFQILAILLEHAGKVVTREELREKLWPADTFVDFDNGLNACISKLRQALGDSTESPRFIETLARRGYRFLAPVEEIAPAPVGVSSAPPAVPLENTSAPAAAVPPRSRFPLGRPLATVGCLVAFLALLIGLNVRGWRYRLLGPPATARIRSLAVLPLQNLSGDQGAGVFCRRHDWRADWRTGPDRRTPGDFAHFGHAI